MPRLSTWRTHRKWMCAVSFLRSIFMVPFTSREMRLAMFIWKCFKTLANWHEQFIFQQFRLRFNASQLCGFLSMICLGGGLGELGMNTTCCGYPRLPDPTPFDFFLWGHVKGLVYYVPSSPTSLKGLWMRIADALETNRRHSAVYLAGTRPAMCKPRAACGPVRFSLQ